MSYDIINTTHGKSTIKVMDVGTYTIELGQLEANANLETVSSATITELMWSTSGFILIKRNTTPVFNLFGSGAWVEASALPPAGANNKTANLVFEINTAGTVVCVVKKEATYNVADLYQVK